MTVIARGKAQVRAYEHAIGGDPPEVAFESIQNAMVRRAAEETAKHQRNSEQRARVSDSTTGRLLTSILGDHPELRAQLEAVGAENRQQLRSEHHLIVPKSEKVEPQIATPAGIELIKGPPYDWQWSQASPGQSGASANKDAGTYNLYALSKGGSDYAMAALGVWFYANTDNQTQRFSVVIYYSDVWQYYAPGDTNCSVTTTLGIWGYSEKNWVQTADVLPNPAAGGSFFESNTNYPDGDSGNVASEIHFPANANNWYLGVIQGSAWGVAGGSIIGPGFAQIAFGASVPFVVFASQ